MSWIGHPDGFKINKNKTPARRLIGTKERLGELRKIICNELILRDWGFDSSDTSMKEREVFKFVRGDIELRFELKCSFSSEVVARYRDFGFKLNRGQSIQSQAWEIYGDNDESWRDAVSAALNDVTGQLGETRDNYDAAILQVRSLPNIRSST